MRLARAPLFGSPLIVWAVPAREETVVAGGIPLRVVRAGEGPPLLMINGLGASVEMWDPLVRHLPGRELIAFDLPGAGLSGHGRWPMRMGALARLVETLLSTLECRAVDVLGYSLGGLLAQELAYRASARVRRLVLAATIPGTPSIPPNPFVGLMMLTPARYYDRRLAEFIIPRIAGGLTARDRKVLEAELSNRLAQPPTPIGYLHQMYSILGWSSHLWLHRLRHPTLVVHGDDDPVAPLLNARYMANEIPQARLHIVRGGGHLFLYDQPAYAAAAIEEFLNEEQE